MQTNDEQAIFHELWRTAGQSPEGVTVPCESAANATRLRFALYNSLKPIKTGKMEADMKLRHAMDTCSLSFTEDKQGLIIRPKVSTTINKAILAVLGKPAIKGTEEILMEESVARMQERLTSAEPSEPKVSAIATKYGARS